VPGLLPHPLRGGHQHSALLPEGPRVGLPWEEDLHYLHGLDLFDQRYVWEAHEVWEGRWRQEPRDSSAHQGLQGLIQVAAALLKAHCGQPAPARALAERGLARLEGLPLEPGGRWKGLELKSLREDVHQCLLGGPWPLLRR
jgi:predicted metal-dependent hydrolase